MNLSHVLEVQYGIHCIVTAEFVPNIELLLSFDDKYHTKHYSEIQKKEVVESV